MRKMLGRISAILVSVIGMMLILGYAVDPFNVFHWKSIRDNGIEPNKNYIKTNYILQNPEKYTGFLMGSSRVGSIHTEKVKNQRIYNMTYSMGTPQENLETLQVFLESGVRIETLYLGLDNISYTEDVQKHNHQPIRASYSFLQNPIEFMKLYCDPAIMRQGVAAILSKTNSVGYDSFYEYGWWCGYDVPTLKNWPEPVAEIETQYFLEDALNSVRQIKELCDENGITLTVFINPVSEYKMRMIDQKIFSFFLDELAQITPFYNFSGRNQITLDPGSYVDSGHCSAAVGDLVLNRICGEEIDPKLLEQGFGEFITAESRGKSVN